MLKIRKAKPKDSKQIKKLITEIMKKEFPGSQKVYPSDDIHNPAKYYNGKKDVFFVAEENKRIIGTVAIKEDTCYTAILRRLFVKKEFRGKGFGSKLINKAIDFCKRHNYKKVIFRGAHMMESALKACLKNGFKEKDIINLPYFKMFILEKRICS
jgi:N-acetylglutamate synthase-like GNAT family acetyltransferase